MKRQSGIRVKLSLFIPYVDGDLDALANAIAASKNLRTREGLMKLANFPDVEIEKSSADNTSREVSA